MSRRPLDAYLTPDDLAAALVSALPIDPGDVAWEPHAGGGAFVRALASRRAHVHWSDIDPDAPAYHDPRLVEIGSGHVAHDALTGWPWTMRSPPDWIVGNPPFQGFASHIDAALAVAPNVAFLLRLAVMESAARAPCWQRWPLRRVWVLAERPSFTGKRNDNAAYGWFHFHRGYTGTAEIVPGWSWKVRA